MASYTCDSGYTLVGDAMRTCTVNRWNGTNPVCGKVVLNILIATHNVIIINIRPDWGVLCRPVPRRGSGGLIDDMFIWGASPGTAYLGSPRPQAILAAGLDSTLM